jgi:hypothetical protein
MLALRVLFVFCPVAAFLCAAVPVAAQPKDKIDVLFDRINQLYGSGKFAEALKIATETRDLTEKEFGTDDRRFNRAVRAAAHGTAPV